GVPRWHTINHPDRRTLATVFDRILDRLPAGLLTDPPRIGDREPLGATRAPVEPAVERALGLPAGEPAPGRAVPSRAAATGARSGEWLVDGSPVPSSAIIDAHLDWYSATPGVV